MSCQRACGCTTNSCGCQDSALTTPSSCPPTEGCPEPPECAEVWDSRCIIFNGNGIYEFNVLPGDSLNSVFEKLILFATNPSCADFNSECYSVIGLTTTTVTSSGIILTWDNSAVATQYVVEYKEASAMSWTVNPTVIAPNHTDSIGGLAPATEYYIRVNATNGNASPICSCYSLTIKVTTLNA